MKKFLINIGALCTISVAVLSCQDLDRSELGDYPQDNAVLPAGSLRFYVPFDKEDSRLRYQFSEELSGYPSFTPDKSIQSEAGISGKAYKGSTSAFLKYLTPNDFVAKASSFTISYWMKHGATTNSAEHIFSIPSSNEHWTKGSMMLMNESTSNGIAVKMILVDKNKVDTWLTWEGAGNAVPVSGFFDNQWHHCAFVYNANNSSLTFYKDGVQFGTPKTWGTHGPVNMDATKVTGFNLGGQSGSDSWMKPWAGNLDQFRMYDSALTSAEINDLFVNKK
ncbi:Concanavalin A-like lectin/glucanases superfamily protein [Chryseobacterium taihuense]|uniref:Concanavalin A-like lectin/glucanases superfamily protein n=1 Tax=Chryseobacterium taihuense TaxID=1141221 RepID=A0ABY0QVN1_9FLAO|nr:Concanavalin A-like lectin/glucanases superfamily protein [Chryseobacterium taihuense]